ncbi:MAG: transcriptional regulator [Candidatus Aramenus sp.]|nr:transcriptional regulator [Candidatus Aramenus sp.]
MKKVIAPCEVVSRSVIPAIKAMIVIELYRRKVPQTQIASFLGITTAEVNYYIKGKRGNSDLIFKLQQDEEFVEAVRITAEKIVKEDEVINLCPLCSLARKKTLKDGNSCPFDW